MGNGGVRVGNGLGYPSKVWMRVKVDRSTGGTSLINRRVGH